MMRKVAVFLGVHKISQGMKEAQVAEGFAKYKESAKSKGLNPLSVVYSMKKGFAYCQTEADSADQVREAHENVASSPEDVVEVKTLS